MTEFVKSWGALAGSISAIIALLTLILIKPIRNLIKRKKDAKVAAAKTITDFQADVIRELHNIKDITQNTSAAVADLQCDRLNQAHDYYMNIGYCPTDTKRILCKMYRAYHDAGHNHLSEQYEEDLLRLPSEPHDIKELVI